MGMLVNPIALVAEIPRVGGVGPLNFSSLMHHIPDSLGLPRQSSGVGACSELGGHLERMQTLV